MILESVNWATSDAAERTAVLQRPVLGSADEQRTACLNIINEVRSGGDAAVAALTARFDSVAIADARVSDAELQQAEAEISPAALAAIDLAIANVRAFHAAQMPASIRVETMPGVTCERISHAIDSVGLYVPAGTAPLPSAAVMLAAPAALAGCPTRIMCTPPRKDGSADPAVLVAATRAGVSDIYKIGGAQAIAAMAYGTATVPKVCKIFGPGNSWVTVAKSIVSADPDGAAIDMPAGPSEVMVIADGNASPRFVAADLLSQAEHGADSQVMLVTTSTELAQATNVELAAQIKNLSRAAIAQQALQHSRCVVVDDIQTAVEISNRYAPEHLILQIDSPGEHVASLRNAGSVFVGPWTPESVGDYCSGTNHVLPTHGYARAYSGLGVDQFLRQITVQELTREGLENIGDAVVQLATLEGLDAHAAAVTLRREDAG